MCRWSRNKQRTGGMVTKIQAARITMNAGIDMVLTNGQRPEMIMDILKGLDVGTLLRLMC